MTIQKKRSVVCNIMLCVLTILLCSGWGTVTHAQTVAPSASSMMTQPGINGVTDIFIGRNTRGPYMLSWKNIEPNSDVVIRDGITLSRDRDYTIDPASGMLAFSTALPSSGIVRVTYGYRSEKAAANTAGMTLPISLDLLNREGSKLQVLGLYKEQDQNKSDSSKTIFGLSGSTKRDATEITTTLLTTTNAGDGANESLSMWDKSGIKLGAKTAAADGRLSLSGSYARAGEQFAGATEYGLKTGYETYDVGAALRASDTVQASFSLKRLEDVSGLGKGTSVESQLQQVVVGSDHSPKFTATREAEESVGADGITTNSATTETFALEHSFGQKANVSASKETKAVSIGDFADTTDTMNVTVNVAPAKNMQVSGRRTMIDSDADGTQTITDLNVSAKPLDQLKLEARYLGQEKEVGGEDVARQIKFETKPMGSLKTKIIGVYSDQVSDTVSSSSKEARLEMNPLRCATLGGGYLTRDDGNITSTVTDVAGTIKPSQYLELSGSYKNRETTGVEDVESKAVNIALAPAKRVRLTGSYESNPEDKYGAVQQFESKSLGLETRLGSLSLSAAYALKDDYLIGRQAYERRFGADLPLFRHGKLTTGYKESESFQYGQESATTYSLGYQHNVGSSFTFSLTGYLTQYERDRAVLDDQTDYMAETKLGIRF